mgnify:CR=1 FL=1
MNDLIKTCIHFCNLSYTNNEYIRLSLLDDAKLEEEREEKLLVVSSKIKIEI